MAGLGNIKQSNEKTSETVIEEDRKSLEESRQLLSPDDPKLKNHEQCAYREGKIMSLFITYMPGIYQKKGKNWKFKSLPTRVFDYVDDGLKNRKLRVSKGFPKRINYYNYCAQGCKLKDCEYHGKNSLS